MTDADTPSNWAVWTGVTDPDFEIIATADPDVLAGIHGLQIISQAASTGLDMSNTTIASTADSTLDLGGASGATFGEMTLGASATLTVEGNVALAPAGACGVEFSGATAGKLVSTGTVTLTGTSLDVLPIGGGNEFKAGAYVVIDADTHFAASFLLSEHGHEVYLSSNFGGSAGGWLRSGGPCPVVGGFELVRSDWSIVGYSRELNRRRRAHRATLPRAAS